MAGRARLTEGGGCRQRPPLLADICVLRQPSWLRRALTAGPGPSAVRLRGTACRRRRHVAQSAHLFSWARSDVLCSFGGADMLARSGSAFHCGKCVDRWQSPVIHPNGKLRAASRIWPCSFLATRTCTCASRLWQTRVCGPCEAELVDHERLCLSGPCLTRHATPRHAFRDGALAQTPRRRRCAHREGVEHACAGCMR